MFSYKNKHVCTDCFNFVAKWKYQWLKKSPPLFKKYVDIFGMIHKILLSLHTYIVLQDYY